MAPGRYLHAASTATSALEHAVSTLMLTAAIRGLDRQGLRSALQAIKEEKTSRECSPGFQPFID